MFNKFNFSRANMHVRHWLLLQFETSAEIIVKQFTVILHCLFCICKSKTEGTSCNQFNPIHAGWTCRASLNPRTSSTTLQTKNIWIQRLQSQGHTIHSYPGGWCCITCGVLLQTKQKSLLHGILNSSAA